MKENYYLHKDQEARVSFDLPQGWVPAYFVASDGEKTTASVEQMLRDALATIDDVPLRVQPRSPLPWQSFCPISTKEAMRGKTLLSSLRSGRTLP
jgi:hypothetical protein